MVALCSKTLCQGVEAQAKHTASPCLACELHCFQQNLAFMKEVPLLCMQVMLHDYRDEMDESNSDLCEEGLKGLRYATCRLPAYH